MSWLHAQAVDSTFGVLSSFLPDINYFYGATACRFPGTWAQAHAALHLPDGRIILAGNTHSSNSTYFALARLLPDGNFDLSMGPDGQRQLDPGLGRDSCLAAVLYGSNRILMGGCSATSGTDFYKNFLVRTDLDGNIDATFGINGKIEINLPTTREMVTKMIVLSNEKILIAGNALKGGQTLWDSDSTWAFVGRLMPDGAIDSTFGVNGFIYRQWEENCGFSLLGDIVVDHSEKIIMTGGSYLYEIGMNISDPLCLQRIAVCRYLANGQPDPSFGTLGSTLLDSHIGRGNALLTYGDGRILVAGVMGFSSPAYTFFARLLPNGSMDSTFSNDGIFWTQALFINIGDAAPGEPIGLIRLQNRIIAGVMIGIEQTHYGLGALALTEDGKIDSTFAINGRYAVQPTFSFFNEINQISTTDPDHFFLSGYIRSLPPNRMMIVKVKMPPSSSSTSELIINKLSLLPNPVILGSRVVVDLGDAFRSGKILGMAVYDIYGKETIVQPMGIDINEVSIETASLAPGVYTITLFMEKSLYIGKLVVLER